MSRDNLNKEQAWLAERVPNAALAAVRTLTENPTLENFSEMSGMDLIGMYYAGRNLSGTACQELLSRGDSETFQIFDRVEEVETSDTQVMKEPESSEMVVKLITAYRDAANEVLDADSDDGITPEYFTLVYASLRKAAQNFASWASQFSAKDDRYRRIMHTLDIAFDLDAEKKEIR